MAKAHDPLKMGSDAQRLLLILWLTAVFGIVGLGIVAAIVWCLVPPLVFDQAFLGQFGMQAGYFYADQPRKSLAFEIGCLAAPFAIAASYVFSRFLVAMWKDSFLPAALRGAVWISSLFILWCYLPLAYCPDPPLDAMPPSWLLSKWFFAHRHLLAWPRFVSLGLYVAFDFFLARRRPSARDLDLTLLVLLGIVILLFPGNVYPPVQMDGGWRFAVHFGVISHALSQVINGHHLLVHFSHLYGGYVEFLGPILALFPRRIETLLIPFPLLNAATLAASLFCARLVIRYPQMLLVTGIALLALECIATSEDHYYQHGPIRTLFPTFGLLAALFYFRGPNRFKYGLVSVIAALAPLWNFDSGIVLWLSWTATLASRQLSSRKLVSAAIQPGIQAVFLAAAVLGYLLYLRLVSGLWPDVGAFFTYQALVLNSGFFCVGMLVPDLWVIVLVIYLIGLITAFHFYYEKKSTWKTDFVFMLSLLGIGQFLYFIGRSAECNLIAAGYGAVFLVGVLFSESRRLVTFKRLPRITWALLLPFGLIPLWWAFVFTFAFPTLLAQSGTVLRTWDDQTPTPFRSNAGFVQKWTVPGEETFMLSNQSGYYYYLSGTVCPINIPGPSEMMLTRHLEILEASLDSARLPKLFVEQDYFGNNNGLRDDVDRRLKNSIAEHYRAEAVSPTGQVTLYVPREKKP